MKKHSFIAALLLTSLTAATAAQAQSLDYSQLVSLWRLDNHAADSFGPNDGTFVGETKFEVGPRPDTGSALFDGSSYIKAGHGISFEASDAFTATAWIKGPPQNSAIIGRMMQGGEYTGWELHVGDRPGVLNVWIINQFGPRFISVYGSTPVLDESWHHVAMSYDGSGSAAGVRIYVDGQDDTWEISSDTLSGTIVPAQAELGLGTRQSGANHNFHGNLSEVSLWKTELTQAQVQAVYQNGINPPMTFAAGASQVFAGMPLTLSWEAEPGTTLSIDQGIGDVTAITANGKGTKEVAPEVPTTYTITATKGGNTQTKSVTVGIKPLLVAFASSATQVPQGTPVSLSWTAHPQARLTLTPGIGDLAAHTINGAGSLELSPTQTTTFTLKAERGSSSAELSVAVAVAQISTPDFSELVSLWRFNDDTADSFGPNPALYYGLAEEYTEGPRPGSKAIVLDGSSYVSAGYDLAFDTSTPFSAAAWINGPLNQDSAIVGRMRQGGGYTGWEFHVGTDAGGSGAGRLNVWLINSYGSSFIQVNSPSIVMDDTWHHVAFTYDGSGKAAGVKIYVDGKDATGSAAADNLEGPIVPEDAELNIGSRQNGSFHNFRGSISEVSVWSTALSLGNVADLFNRGVPATLPPPEIRLSSAAFLAPGSFRFSWNSTAGKTYRVEASTNLKDWSVVADNYPVGGAPTDTTIFTDSAASKPASVYRVSPR
jgi:hypothetical protein